MTEEFSPEQAAAIKEFLGVKIHGSDPASLRLLKWSERPMSLPPYFAQIFDGENGIRVRGFYDGENGIFYLKSFRLEGVDWQDLSGPPSR